MNTTRSPTAPTGPSCCQTCQWGTAPHGRCLAGSKTPLDTTAALRCRPGIRCRRRTGRTPQHPPHQARRGATRLGTALASRQTSWRGSKSPGRMCQTQPSHPLHRTTRPDTACTSLARHWGCGTQVRMVRVPGYPSDTRALRDTRVCPAPAPRRCLPGSTAPPDTRWQPTLFLGSQSGRRKSTRRGTARTRMRWWTT